jgi:hypothetical protein
MQCRRRWTALAGAYFVSIVHRDERAKGETEARLKANKPANRARQ